MIPHNRPQFKCPKENTPCKAVEFDNVKVFYHPTEPNHASHPGSTWNFYIARPGASTRECIDWVADGVEIVAYGPDGHWGECRILTVPPGTRVRISYPFQQRRHTREIVFPTSDPPVPIIHLEGM
jgi:hypothetical protein